MPCYGMRRATDWGGGSDCSAENDILIELKIKELFTILASKAF